MARSAGGFHMEQAPTKEGLSVSTFTATFEGTGRYLDRVASAARLRVDQDGEPFQLFTVGVSDGALLGFDGGPASEQLLSAMARNSASRFVEVLESGQLPKRDAVETFFEDRTTIRSCLDDERPPLAVGDVVWVVDID